MRQSIVTAARHWTSANCSEREVEFKKDINSPMHVFVEHSQCAEYFCDKRTNKSSSKGRTTTLVLDKNMEEWKSVNESSQSRKRASFDAIDMDITELIEKSQFASCGIFAHDIIPQTCPTLPVGLQPVPALTSKVIGNEAALNSYTDSQAYFEVTCEAWIKCAHPTERPLYDGVNTKLSDLIWFNNDQTSTVNLGKSMVHGLYQK